MTDHIPPDFLKFSVILPIRSKLLADASNRWPDEVDVYIDNDITYACPRSGLVHGFNSINQSPMWCVNRFDAGYLQLWMANQKAFEDFKMEATCVHTAYDNTKENANANANTKANAKASTEYKPSRKNVFRYDGVNRRWSIDHGFVARDPVNYVGESQQTQVKAIREAIATHAENRERLEELGEWKPLNFMLYGETGNGKTALYQTLVHSVDNPIYILGAGDFPAVTEFTRVMSSRGVVESIAKIDTSLFIFEGFDRFLAMDGIDAAMSQLLNFLDSANMGGVRLWEVTALTLDNIPPALISRMSNCIFIDKPSRLMLRTRFDQILTMQCRTSDVDRLLDRIHSRGVCMRAFVRWVTRYMFERDPVGEMSNRIDELCRHDI
jgi:ATPase family associated with various cellular activities (AAA)